MKKLLYTLIVLLGLGSIAFGQDKREVAHSKKSELVRSKDSGKYKFVLSSDLSKEEVDKNAKYYTHYFTVRFDEVSHEVSLDLIENEAKSRLVISRFLTACGVNYIKVDQENVSLGDFTERYLK